MVDRTVTARLRLDSSQWVAGQTAAVNANARLATSAATSATSAERAAQRTAEAVAGTFRGMAAQGATSLRALDTAATRSSEVLARTTTAMTAQTAAAATAATRATTQAATASATATARAASTTATASTASAAATARGATAAAASTRQVAVAAGEIPAAFRSAGAAATASLATIDATSAASRAAVARTLLAERQALTAGAAAVTQTTTGIAQVTASGLAGATRLSMATRLTLASAASASQAAAASSAAAAATTAATTTSAYSRLAAGARSTAVSVAAGAARSEQSLKTTRTASLALVAAFGLAVYASSKFETAMSGVKAATQSSGGELLSLRQAAIAAGSATQYSATQAADAETELAKAGVSTADILGGALRGTLNLAAAGQMDVADSAVVAAKAMNSFGLSGKDVGHIADVIAAAAGKSATDVHGMSLAFAQSSLLAHQTGLSLEQTAGSLALFAQNGLVGSDAGTSLKTMLMRLTPQSDQARGVMDKLGFSAYDANGNFVGLTETARRMQKSFAGLTPEARNSAMGIIFGSDAIRAATIVTQAGADGIDTWTKAANDQGYAARYAATQTDNLQGDVHRLASALETALISSGTAANGVLRDMAKYLTEAIRWYSGLSPQVQKSVTILGGLVGVVGLVGSALLLMLPRIMTVRRELSLLGVTAGTTRGAMAALGNATAVVATLALLSAATKELTSLMKDASPTANEMTSSLVDFARTGKASGALAKEYGKDLGGVTDAIDTLSSSMANNKIIKGLDKVSTGFGYFGKGELGDAKDKLKGFDEALAQLVASGDLGTAKVAFEQLAAVEKEHGKSAQQVADLLPQYADALAGVDVQNKLTTGSQKSVSEALKGTADELQDTRTEVQKLGDALDALNGANISVAQSAISFRQSLADLKSTVKDNGHSLDITTQKGRNVEGAFLDAADAAMAHAKAVTEQTNSQAAGNKVLGEDIAVLKAQMLQMGFQKDAVDKLLASYAQVPGQKVTEVSVKDSASAELERIHDSLDKTKGKSITVKALTAAAETNLLGLGFKVTHMPNGTVKISVPTGSASRAVDALQGRIDSLVRADHTIHMKVAYSGLGAAGAGTPASTGKGKFADGGIAHAAQGLYVPGYRPRVDTVPAWLSEGEGVLVPETVRRLGMLSGMGPAGAIKALNSWGRYGTALRFSGGGTVGGGQHFASGGFTYAPASPTATLGVDAGWDRYTDAVARVNAAGKTLAAALADAAKKAAAVRDAEQDLSRVRSHHHTAAQLAAAEERLAKARDASAASARKAASDRKALNSADSALGVKAGTTTVGGFNLAAYEKQLAAANKANAAWEKNLASIGGRAGQDVEDILRGMGSDGTALVAALAKATGSQFTKIVNQLKQLAPTAQATLRDYTAQLTAATKGSAAFQANLLTLAAMGDTALAAQLAAQGDDAAAAIAAAAVKSPGAASAANKAAAANAAVLSAEDLAAAVTLLGVLKAHPGAGIADVLAAGLDWTAVRALAPRIAAQIKSVPGSGEFVTELRGQGVAMARGGILTRPTAVLAAEAGHTESWIPWDGSARAAALLSATAGAMGYQLVPAGRWGTTSASGGGQTHVDRSQTVHLHGAHQSLGEQRADLLRHMTALG